ncbi:MAG: hypothetical protein ACXVB1_18415 [Pseudobdellovibrionaceae bacterium]
MKYLFIIITTLFSLYSFAENNNDLLLMPRNSHCIPVRDKNGHVSTYQCDGPLDKKMKHGEFQNSGTQKVKVIELKKNDVITYANGGAVDSPAKAMELYNTMKATGTLTVQRPANLTDKIKSCLAAAYMNQISFHKANGTFTSSDGDLGLNRISVCKGLDLSVDYANQSDFKFIAKAGNKVWSVDETKTMEEVR